MTAAGIDPRRCGFGPIRPEAARRCFSRRTHAVLTEYFAATADVVRPASTSLSTRTRKSIEYVFTASSLIGDAKLTNLPELRYIKIGTALDFVKPFGHPAFN